ncbi:MAG: molybdopterin-dependent oxidoreductase [Clostridiales Family XIII bacterium]|jgi:aldehyde oxidoreductase|nr:molybdopterin-dependent oxidoreductase [Clostridiales Family XIII bacterium]
MAYKKFWFTINGAQRMVTCDPENTTLAELLRRQLGLTGTKVGCGTGQCGACSVILNGKVIRSCVRKVSTLKDYDEITTIEGIGTPACLHPLQIAWNTYGAVQCGFCTPGFIVSAYQLLRENADPSREDVRDWFQKHHNLCRCTGYRPIVDAVMAAAKVLRGEWTVDDITYKIPADGNAYGTRFPRRESGIARVTGLANYGDDIRLQLPKDALEAAPVIATVGHAKILGIDMEQALRMPGVVRILTAKDVTGSNRISVGVGFPRALATGSEKKIFAEDKVSKYGDLIAMVVADTLEHARAAAKVVDVQYEPLPVYPTQLEAILPDSVPIHDGVPNLFMEWPKHKGADTRDVMPGCAYVAEGSFYTQRQPHLPIEPDCANAFIDADGVLTVQYKSQFLYMALGIIAAGVGWPEDKVRVIENESGGSFGYSVSPQLPVIAAACTVAMEGRMVSITLSYAEHQHMSGKRGLSHSNVRIGADKDGKLQAIEYHIGYDAGGYTEFQQSCLTKSHVLAGFPYNVPNELGVSFAAFSNFGYDTPYRSYSSIQIFFPHESLMDVLAEQAGMDPFEFRYKNVARAGDLLPTNVPYNEAPMEEMMDMMRPHYEEAKKKAKAQSTDTVKHGVGIAWGGYLVGLPIDNAQVAIELLPDDTFKAYSTWQDVGQHAEAGMLLHTYTALRPLDVPLDKIKLEMNDTASCPNTGIAGGSRCHFYAGNALLDAAGKLIPAMTKDDGTIRTYVEMVEAGIPTYYEGVYTSLQGQQSEICANTGTGYSYHSMMYDIFLVEAEVDTQTGKTKVNRVVCIADVGKIGNLLGVEGQAYSGIMHGIGFALQEDYSDVQKHASPLGAGFPQIKEITDDIELIWHDSYRDNGPHGSSGCSESFQSSIHCAVVNAIADATGVRVYELPASPETILRGLAGEDLKPDKYYLGDDLYDAVDRLDADPVPEEVNRRYMWGV